MSTGEEKEKQLDHLFDGLEGIMTNKELIPAFLITIQVQLLQKLVDRKILPKEDIKEIILSGMDVVRQQERFQNEVMGIAAQELLKNENIDFDTKRMEDKITQAVLGTLEDEREKAKQRLKEKLDLEQKGKGKGDADSKSDNKGEGAGVNEKN